MLDILEICLKGSIDDISDEYRRLDSYCKNYPDILQFVEKIINWDTDLSRALTGFIYLISGYSINKQNIGWMSDLNSFIGNWFLDDFSFTVISPSSSAMSPWTVKDSSRGDSDWGSQNPLILIQAAEDNCKMYDFYETRRVGESRHYRIDTTLVNKLMEKK